MGGVTFTKELFNTKTYKKQRTMKIEQRKEKPKFLPIQITLETRKEVEELYDVLVKATYTPFTNAMYLKIGKLLLGGGLVVK